MSTIEEHPTQNSKSPIKTPQTHPKIPETHLTSAKKGEEVCASIKKSVVDRNSVPVSPLKSAVKHQPEEEGIPLKEVEKSGRKSETKGKSVSKKSKKEEKSEKKSEKKEEKSEKKESKPRSSRSKEPTKVVQKDRAVDTDEFDKYKDLLNQKRNKKSVSKSKTKVEEKVDENN